MKVDTVESLRQEGLAVASSVVRATPTTHLARAMVPGLAIGISNQLQPFMVEVTPADEYIMHIRLKHTLGFNVSCYSVHTLLPRSVELKGRLCFTPNTY